MSDFELLFQLFALLLGLSMAELLSGLARSWRIGAGAVRTRESLVRIGWLVPLFGLLVLIDLTRFWVTAYALRDHLTFDYGGLLAMLMIVGGYYMISTFVFPDEPLDWPDFDDYFLHTKRTVVGGMILINFTMLARGLVLLSQGLPIEQVPIARNWFSLGAAAMYIPSLMTLWLARSKRVILMLLLLIIALMVAAAFSQRLPPYIDIGTTAAR